MDEQVLRARADAVAAAIVAGDMGPVIEEMSQELRRNLGEVVQLFPLPATEATVESVGGGGGASTTVVLRIVGETEETLLETRWKERDGRPTIIEVSRQPSTPIAAPAAADEAASDETDALDR